MTTPEVPEPLRLRGADLVRELFVRVANGGAGVEELYAADGVLLIGDRRVEGRDAVAAFYRETIAAIHPVPTVQQVLEDDPYYAAVVDVTNVHGRLRAVDLFTLGDDGIVQLEVFRRDA